MNKNKMNKNKMIAMFVSIALSVVFSIGVASFLDFWIAERTFLKLMNVMVCGVGTLFFCGVSLLCFYLAVPKQIR